MKILLFLMALSSVNITYFEIEGNTYYDIENKDEKKHNTQVLSSFVEDFEYNDSENSTFVASDIDIENPGPGGGSSNLSFSTAYDLVLNSSNSAPISGTTKRYFKYTNEELRYLTIYSSGSADSIVRIYDSSYTEIGYKFCDGHDNAVDISNTIYDNAKLNYIVGYNEKTCRVCYGKIQNVIKFLCEFSCR